MSDARAVEVGPILSRGDTTDAILRAIESLNSVARFVDRGSYVRVLCPGRCVLTRRAVESFLGRPFHFPVDLEVAMPSFAGRIAIDEGGATWTA